MVRNFNLKIDWLFWFVILLPTFYIKGMDIRISQMQFFQFAIMALVAIMHVNKWLGAFLGWSLFQFIFFNDIPPISNAFNNLFMGAVAYQFIVLYGDPKNIKKYFWAFMILLGINILWCVRQYFQQDPILMMANQDHQKTFTEYSGFFGLPAFLGNFTAAVLPMAFTLSPILIPVCLAALFFSKSSFSIASALAAGLFYLWFRKRLLFWVLLILGGVSSVFYIWKFDYPTGQFNRRLEVWKIVEKMSYEKQFIGHGIGSFKQYFIAESTPSGKLALVSNPQHLKNFLSERAVEHGSADLVPEIQSSNNQIELKKKMQARGLDFERWESVHNDFLEAFFEGGLIGIFLIGGFIFGFFKRFFLYAGRNIYALTLISSLIAVILCSLGHFGFHLARLGGPFLVIMALLDLCLMDCQRKKEEAW